MTMTAQQIRDAIAADPAMQALAAPGVRNDGEIARRLSIGRTRVQSRLISERGVMSQYAGGPLAADALLTKLETFAASGAPGSGPVKRALKFLGAEAGLDIGDPTMRAQLDALAAAGVITVEEATHLKALANTDDPVPADAVSAALNEVA